jgi:hypothetical protein
MQAARTSQSIFIQTQSVTSTNHETQGSYKGSVLFITFKEGQRASVMPNSRLHALVRHPIYKVFPFLHTRARDSNLFSTKYKPPTSSIAHADQTNDITHCARTR